jgi:Protein of unknown function (DUF1499)
MPKTTRTWHYWIALLALIAGLGVGALALASAAGIWAGVWTFRTGFTLLGLADGHAPWIAGVTLLVAVTVFVLRRSADGRKLATMALCGTIAAVIAYLIPESYRPPEGTPPIHDVSTDTVDPPQYVAVMPLRANAPNTTVYGGSPNMTPERLAELQTEAFPDLKTRHLDEPPTAVFDRALAAVESLGWDIVAAVPEDGRIEATDTTFWFRFKDDVVIRIRPDGGGSVLDARSLSRVGGGDAGTNARRLRRFFATFDES